MRRVLRSRMAKLAAARLGLRRFARGAAAAAVSRELAAAAAEYRVRREMRHAFRRWGVAHLLSWGRGARFARSCSLRRGWGRLRGVVQAVAARSSLPMSRSPHLCINPLPLNDPSPSVQSPRRAAQELRVVADAPQPHPPHAPPSASHSPVVPPPRLPASSSSSPSPLPPPLVLVQSFPPREDGHRVAAVAAAAGDSPKPSSSAGPSLCRLCAGQPSAGEGPLAERGALLRLSQLLSRQRALAAEAPPVPVAAEAPPVPVAVEAPPVPVAVEAPPVAAEAAAAAPPPATARRLWRVTDPTCCASGAQLPRPARRRPPRRDCRGDLWAPRNPLLEPWRAAARAPCAGGGAAASVTRLTAASRWGQPLWPYHRQVRQR